MNIKKILIIIGFYIFLIISLFATFGLSIYISYEWIFPSQAISRKSKKYLFMLLSGLLMSGVIFLLQIFYKKIVKDNS